MKGPGFTTLLVDAQKGGRNCVAEAIGGQKYAAGAAFAACSNQLLMSKKTWQKRIPESSEPELQSQTMPA